MSIGFARSRQTIGIAKSSGLNFLDRGVDCGGCGTAKLSGVNQLGCARTACGTALKIVEPRRRTPGEGQRRFCALAPDARPSIFPRSTSSATE